MQAPVPVGVLRGVRLEFRDFIFFSSPHAHVVYLSPAGSSASLHAAQEFVSTLQPLGCLKPRPLALKALHLVVSMSPAVPALFDAVVCPLAVGAPGTGSEQPVSRAKTKASASARVARC